jgi:signal transduction histidine kinase/integral membrane sensor domain MASE1
MPPWLMTAARCLAVAILYVIAARIGFKAALVAEQVSPVWPPSGLALWAGLYFGSRIWPGIWLGALIANVMTNVPLAAAGGIATGNMLEAMAGAWLLRRVAGTGRTLDNLRQVTTLLVLAAVVSTAISATIGTATLCAAGLQPWSRFGVLWSIWWLGDATGDLLIAPVLLTAPLWWRALRSKPRLLEPAALAVATVALSTLVFVAPFPLFANHPLEFVVFPLVIWAGLRFAHPGAALVSAGISAVAVWGTLHGTGPFSGGAVSSLNESVILLQIYTAVLATSGLAFGAAIADRNRAERLRATDHALTAILSEDCDLDDAVQRILDAVCDRLDWELGIFWRTNEERRVLEFVGSSRRAARFDDFVRHSELRGFELGVGLPGRVWASGRPEWITDVLIDPNFPRAPFAARAGIHVGFAFPVVVRRPRLGGATSQVLAVMEFFARDARQADPSLLALMAAAGAQIGHFIERCNDIADRRRIEADRAELLAREHAARLEAESANRSKDQFLTTVSHELRTPLNAILGWASILRTGQYEASRLPHIHDSVYRNAEVQARIINDLLDVSRVVRGELRLELQLVDVCELARLSLETIRPTAIAKGVSLESDIPSSEYVVSGDPARLQQVIWNLLSNAVKFTPSRGSVSLVVRETIPAGVTIEVRDSGIGIPPAYLPHVFERFWQADSSSTRVHGGLGLGLAIARHIVELHGGEVRAASDGEGRGSTFSVTLPGRALGAAPRDPAARRLTAD